MATVGRAIRQAQAMDARARNLERALRRLGQWEEYCLEEWRAREAANLARIDEDLADSEGLSERTRAMLTERRAEKARQIGRGLLPADQAPLDIMFQAWPTEAILRYQRYA